MENSLGLGLLHGFLFGVTPTAPWFMALKRYLVDGEEKGYVTYAGVLFGQVALLALAFFGWKELVWLWFYLEPLLLVIGFVVMFNAVRVCLLAPRWEMRSHPIQTRQQAASYFFLGAGLVFCNPGELSNLKTVLATVPENRWAYLCAFTLMCGLCMAGIAWLIRTRVFKFSFGKRGNPYQQILQEQYAKRVGWIMIFGLWLHLFSVSPQPVYYHIDNLLTYAPSESVKSKYSKDMIWLQETVKDEEGKKQTTDFQQSAPSWNLNSSNPRENSVRPTILAPAWRTQYAYTKFMKRSERKLGFYRRNVERILYEQRGRNQKLVNLRMQHLRVAWLPAWDDAHTLTHTLPQIREEFDNKISEDGRYQTQMRFLPDDKQFEADQIISEPSKDVSDKDPSRLAEYTLRKWLLRNTFEPESIEVFHTGYEGGALNSSAKLQSAPPEARFPWDYPALPPTTVQFERPWTQTEPEDVKPIDAAIAEELQFFDPIVVNTRLRTNDPEDLARRVALDGPDKFDTWSKNIYHRARLWKLTRTTEPGNDLENESEPIWLQDRVPTRRP